MTKQQIKEVAKKAVEKQEDLNLYQAILWAEDYGIIPYKLSAALRAAIVDAEKAQE